MKKRISIIAIFFMLVVSVLILTGCFGKTCKITGDIFLVETDTFKIVEKKGEKLAYVKTGTRITFKLNKNRLDPEKEFIKIYYVKKGENAEHIIDADGDTSVLVDKDIEVKAVYKEHKFVKFTGEDVKDILSLDYDFEENDKIKEKTRQQDGETLYRAGLKVKIILAEYHISFRDCNLNKVEIDGVVYNKNDTFLIPNKENVEVSFEINKADKTTSIDLSKLDNYHIFTSLTKKNSNISRAYKHDEITFDFTNCKEYRKEYIKGLKINGKDYFYNENKKLDYVVKDDNLEIEIIKAAKTQIEVLFDNVVLSPNFILEKHFDLEGNKIEDLDAPIFYKGDKITVSTRTMAISERLEKVLINNHPRPIIDQSYSETVKITDEPLKFVFEKRELEKVTVKLDDNIRVKVIGDLTNHTYTNEEFLLYPYQEIVIETNWKNSENNIFEKIENNSQFFTISSNYRYVLKENENLDLVAIYADANLFYQFDLDDFYKDTVDKNTLINDENPREYYKKGTVLRVRVSSEKYIYTKMIIDGDEILLDKNFYEFKIEKNTILKIQEDSIKQIKTDFFYENYYDQENTDLKDIVVSNMILSSLNRVALGFELVLTIKNDKFLSENITFIGIEILNDRLEKITDPNIVRFEDENKRIIITVTKDVYKIAIEEGHIARSKRLILTTENIDITQYLILQDNSYTLTSDERQIIPAENGIIIRFKLKPGIILNYYQTDKERKEFIFEDEIEIDLREVYFLTFYEDSLKKESDIDTEKINTAEYYNINKLYQNNENYNAYIKPADREYLFLDSVNKKAAFKKLPKDKVIIKTVSKDVQTGKVSYKFSLLEAEIKLISLTTNISEQQNFSTENFENKEARKKSYEVGGLNIFIPFTSCKYFIHNGVDGFIDKTTNADEDLLSIDLNYVISQNGTVLTLGDDYDIQRGYRIDFSKIALKNKNQNTDKNKILIKYQFKGEEKQMEVILVNDGYNFYTQKELYEKFNDNGKCYYILHRNLLLDVRDDQYSSLNHPDYNSHPDEKIRNALGRFSNTKSFHNSDNSSYFLRTTSADEFTFNGNFFSLNAKNTPKIRIENSFSHYQVADPYAGIIMYYPDISTANTFCVKNVKLIGNTSHPASGVEVGEGIPAWASGGILGIRTFGNGKVWFDNLEVYDTATAFHTKSTQVKITNTKADNSFSASIIYSNYYGPQNSGSSLDDLKQVKVIMKLECENNVLLQSGGPALTLIDLAKERRGYYIPSIFDNSKKEYQNEKRLKKMTETPKDGIDEDLWRASYNLDPTIYIKDTFIQNLTDGKSPFFEAFKINAAALIATIAKEAFGNIDKFLVDSVLHKCHVNTKGEVNLAISLQNPLPGVPEKNDIHMQQALDFNYWDKEQNKWIRSYRGSEFRYGESDGIFTEVPKKILAAQIPALITSPGYNLVGMFNSMERLFDPVAPNIDYPVIGTGLMAGSLYTGLTGELPKLNTKNPIFKDIASIPSSILESTLEQIILDSQDKNNKVQNALTNAFIELMPSEYDTGVGTVRIAAALLLGVFNNDVPEWML